MRDHTRYLKENLSVVRVKTSSPGIDPVSEKQVGEEQDHSTLKHHGSFQYING